MSPNSSNRLFTTEIPFLVSLLGTQSFGLGLYQKPWTLRHLDIYSDGQCVIRHKDSIAPHVRVIKVLNVNQVDIRTIALDHEAIEMNGPDIRKEIGFHIKCKKENGADTYFRCILNDEQISPFLSALQEVNPSQQISLKNIMTAPVPRLGYRSVVNNPLIPATATNSKEKDVRLYISTQSVMRRAVTHAMDSYIIQDTCDHILSRRGAFKFLPVAFSNDLIHGSWYFAAGSIVMVVTSGVILYNSFDEVIGDDDSFLSPKRYRATWALMLISGIFFTLGSFAFIRAVHDEPPMKPLFTWHHLQNDELLGSWCFLFGTIPVLPYCMIYMGGQQDVNLVLYIAGLVVASLLVLGAFIFVWASYPSEKNGRQYALPFVRTLCCCVRRDWLDRNLANDWLAACWLIFYGTLIATIATLALLIHSISIRHDLTIFVNGSYFVENAFFLLGTAYFVAGSYPDELRLKNEQGDDNMESQHADYILVNDNMTSRESL